MAGTFSCHTEGTLYHYLHNGELSVLPHSAFTHSMATVTAVNTLCHVCGMSFLIMNCYWRNGCSKSNVNLINSEIMVKMNYKYPCKDFYTHLCLKKRYPRINKVEQGSMI